MTTKFFREKNPKLSFEDACFQWASGFYLTEHLPDEWFIEQESDWSEGYDSFEEYQDDILESTLWEPFQFYEAKQIAQEIDSLAYWIRNGQYPKKEDYEN